MKILPLIIFELKYSLKRSIVMFVILGVILTLVYSKSPISGVGKGIKSDFTSIKIIDNDSSALSKEFENFLLNNRNFSENNDSITTVIIPKGFEEQFNNNNATIQSGFLGFLGVNEKDIYEFQLYKLNSNNKIRVTGANLSGTGTEQLAVLLLLAGMLSSISYSLINGRKTGEIAFISNHLNFWVYLITCRIPDILFMIVAVTATGSFKLLMLFIILLFILTYIAFMLRRNNRLGDYMFFAVVGVLGLLLWCKIRGFNLPLVDLLSPGFSWMIIIDTALLIMSFLLISKLRVTEK